MKTKNVIFLSLIAPAVIAAMSGQALAQQAITPFSGSFRQGSLILSRVGDGSAALSNAATAVFLDEFRITSGRGASAVVSYGQTLALGTSTAGQRQTNSGTATSELALSYARDTSGNDYVFLAGYDAAAGASGVANSAGTTTQRVATRVSITGNTTYATLGTTAFSGNNIRSVASTDGTTFYASGGNSGIQTGSFPVSSGGVTTTQFGATTPTNFRVVNATNGGVYASGASGTFQGVGSFTSSTTTLLNGFPTASGPQNYDFVFANASTIYVADDRTSTSGGLQRWNLSSGTWSLAYTINVPGITTGTFAGLRGLTSFTDPTNGQVDFYAVSTDNRLIGVTDLLSNTTNAGASVSALVGQGFFGTNANYAFRGVELIPAPGSLALLGLGGLIATRRRR